MISINNLTKNFKGLVALDNVTFDINSNMILGFVGPNGAGKSTMIKILSGITRKTFGEVRILDHDIDQNVTIVKKNIGVIPEELALFDGLTGEEHLNFVASLYNLDKLTAKTRIKEILQHLDLFTAKNRQIGTYSLGMRKKLSFAAAIIHKPEILLLDEPFESVDPISRRKMKSILNKFRKNGSIILITSHALNEIEDFCDEVVIINNGQVIFRTDTKNIRNKIKNELTNETYQSLEEIFVDLTIEEEEKEKKLSWI